MGVDAMMEAFGNLLPEVFGVKGVVICGAREAQCVCHEPSGHEGPHECLDRLTCNGAWEDEPFRIVRFPGLDAPEPSPVFEFLFGGW